MKILLDTHALLWWLADDAQLGPPARKLIADPNNDVLASIVSLWEIAVKIRAGKLEADLGQITDAIRQDGFTLLAITVPQLLALARLPMHHRDPFDHLLIAQAITEDATFLSQDRNISRYPVPMLPCSAPTPRSQPNQP
ncbi:MAG TPA: type II toxin-antitoxin system VapC family toxin [Rhodopila sp.]|jgi:PIN domain nuclease of toxin-antitoxin system|nr:type II toxin-antitoxin system VapC family toxin [Rhodopila sp.]